MLRTMSFHDLILKEVLLPDGLNRRFVVEWIWSQVNPPGFTKFPADFGMKDLSESQKKQLDDELEMWTEKRFIAPTNPQVTEFTIPLRAVIQAHKKSKEANTCTANDFLCSGQQQHHVMDLHLQLLVER